MAIVKRAPFGMLDDLRVVDRYLLVGNGGLTASILDYGATVQSLCFGGVDTVLGYDNLEGYLAGTSFQGASIGRYGNRIENSRFVIDGETYTLAANEKGVTNIHGGVVGFDKKIWDAEILETAIPAVRFSLVSEDGEEGFPGRLKTSVTYSITDDNALHIVYEAVSDKDTHYNPTCHAYFNLNGAVDESALDLSVQIRADKFTAVDDLLIPVGDHVAVEGTPFDFRTPKPLGQDILADFEQLAVVGQGYDHNFVLTGEQPFATVISKKRGIGMDCYTDQPGVQLYSATCLDDPNGKGGVPLKRFAALCLETQHFPNTPNRADYPTTLIKANEPFTSETIYRFYKI